MNVGVCITKRTERGFFLLKAFTEGIKRSGDEVREVETKSQLKRLAKYFDIFLMFGWLNLKYAEHSKSDKILFRKAIFDFAKEKKKKIIVIDTGFLNYKTYCSVGLNGIKNYAEYFNKNSPPDRFKALEMPIEPWRIKGKHILVFGQNQGGVSCSELDIFKWHVQIIEKIREFSDRPIRFRSHPRQKIIQDTKNFPSYVSFSKGSVPLDYDLKNCWCAVGYTTNALCETLLRGIPVISFSEGAMTYNVSDHLLDKLENPSFYNRVQFFCDLAYAQWNFDEFRKGLPWRHLKENLLKGS